MNSQPSNNYMPSYGVATKLHNDSATSASSLSKKSTTNKKNATTSLSGSETDVSTSTENLSQEERYVIKHTARQEPQGQEKQEPTDGLTHHSGRQLSLDNASSYNTLIIHATGEDGLDPWASLSPSRLSSLRDSYISATSSHSKASFPSSSASSSPTLASTTQGQTREINEIPDDYLSQSHILKHLAKEMKVVAPDMKEDYETNPPRRLLLLDLSAETHSRITGHRYSTPIYASAPIDVQGKLALSRSQPDLTQIEVAKVVQERTSNSMHRQNVKNKSGTLKTEVDWPASEMIQLLVKENSSLKTELEMCYKKVAKSQKLEEEVTNIHRSHQELMQSSERREKLERAARQRLQEDNRMLRQQYELLLAQMESPLSGGTASNSTEEILILKREIGKRDTMLAQLMAQNKELTGCRERQDIELAAQRATLQEQRTHIDILDTALTNAQANVMRLEEECRKRQLYEERVVQLQQNLSSLQLARDKLEGEMNDLRLSRRANNATAQGGMLSSDKKIDPNGQSLEVQELLLKIRERDERLVALENEVTRWQQWYLEENAMRQVVIDAASIPKDAKIAALEKTSQESERLMAEARTDKIRQLDELHAAQRRLANVEGRSRELESKLAEKEAMIKVLQQQHHSIASSGSVLSRASPHLHHSSSSSFHRQPSPSPMSSIMLSSLAGKSSPLTSDLGAAVTSSTTTLSSLPRGLCNIRSSSLGFQRSSSVVADYGTSSGPPSTTSSSSPMISNPTKNATASSSLSRSYNEDTRSLDEQLQGLDSQLLSGRVLCCFSGLYNRGIAARKEGLSQPLLVGLKRRPPLNPRDDYKTLDSDKDSSSGVYNRYKSASPSGKQFHSRYSPNPTGSLPPTPPLNDNELYFMQRYSNKSSLPPTPPSSSSKDSYFRYNPASLPPTPPPPCMEDRHHKSSSLHETSKCNHEIMLLEKQGRASQKQRRSSAGSQASSDDMNSSRLCLPSAIPRPKSRPLESPPSTPTKMNRKGGYNRLEEATSKESLNSTLPSNNVASKLRLFQQSSKSKSSFNSSREKLNSGMKYRIQL